MTNYSPADELVLGQINTGITKANRGIVSLIFLSLLAGFYISLGGAVSSIIFALTQDLSVGLAKVLSAATFSVGIVAVVLGGADLFTGHSLMIMALSDRQISTAQLLKNWGLVWIFNFIGSILMAILFVKGGIFPDPVKEYMIKVAGAKSSLPFLTALLRGVGANFVVCLGVWLAAAAKDSMAKIIACAFPISVFVMMGLEHSVANMFFFPAAYLMGADLSLAHVFINNLIPVTLGNVLGGMCIGLCYYIPFASVHRKR